MGKNMDSRNNNHTYVDINEPTYPVRLCGFTFKELVALRADLYEAAIFKTWNSEYSAKARQRLRRILQLTEEEE